MQDQWCPIGEWVEIFERGETFFFWITIDFKPYYGDEEQQLCILEKVKMLSIGVESKFLLHFGVGNSNKVFTFHMDNLGCF